MSRSWAASLLLFAALSLSSLGAAGQSRATGTGMEEIARFKCSGGHGGYDSIWRTEDGKFFMERNADGMGGVEKLTFTVTLHDVDKVKLYKSGEDYCDGIGIHITCNTGTQCVVRDGEMQRDSLELATAAYASLSAVRTAMQRALGTGAHVEDLDLVELIRIHRESSDETSKAAACGEMRAITTRSDGRFLLGGQAAHDAQDEKSYVINHCYRNSEATGGGKQYLCEADDAREACPWRR